MNIKNLSLLTLVASMALSTACVVDDDPAGDTDTETNATTMTNTDPTNMTDPTASTTSTTDPSETEDTTVTDTDDTDTDPTDDTDTDTDTEAGDPDVYDFRDDDPASYTQVDRKGFPAVNTALIPTKNQDAYNASNPAGDVTPADTFAADAIATLQFLHSTPTDDETNPIPGEVGLDDDLVLANTLLGTSLVPCGADVTDNSCLQQAVPLVFPDVLLLDTGAPPEFPNGRALEVPVVDIILAAVLINVSSDPALLGAFATVGLSQSPNDVAFEASFPYLGAAHE